MEIKEVLKINQWTRTEAEKKFLEDQLTLLNAKFNELRIGTCAMNPTLVLHDHISFSLLELHLTLVDTEKGRAMPYYLSKGATEELIALLKRHLEAYEIFSQICEIREGIKQR